MEVSPHHYKDITMGLFDDVFSGGQQQGYDDISKGYAQAGQYYQPFWQNGVNANNNISNWANQFANPNPQYANMGQQQWNAAQQTPMDYYNSIMKNYTTSPQAQYALNQMNLSNQRAASASGMLGSGAFQKGIQANANNIMQNDMQQYFNNVQGANNMQMGYLDNYQNQQNRMQDRYQQIMEYLSGLGLNAGQGMADSAIGQGYANAGQDMAQSQGINNFMGGLSGLLGQFTNPNGAGGTAMSAAEFAGL